MNEPASTVPSPFRRDTSVELFGRRYAMPLILAPTGYTRMVRTEGEPAVARAAAAAIDDRFR